MLTIRLCSLNVDGSGRPGGWRDWRERYGGCFGIYFVSLPMPMDAMELYIAWNDHLCLGSFMFMYYMWLIVGDKWTESEDWLPIYASERAEMLSLVHTIVLVIKRYLVCIYIFIYTRAYFLVRYASPEQRPCKWIHWGRLPLLLLTINTKDWVLSVWGRAKSKGANSAQGRLIAASIWIIRQIIIYQFLRRQESF